MSDIKTNAADDRLLTFKEAAAILKVSRVTVHNLRKKGILVGYKIGRSMRFKESELLKNAKTS